MIEFIEGTLDGECYETGEAYLMVGPVQIRVRVPIREIEKACAASGLWTVLCYKNETFCMYAFFYEESQELFKKLCEVHGLGPAMAMRVLDTMTPREVMEGVSEGGPGVFMGVAGIGKKTAEAIVRAGKKWKQ